MPSKQTGNTDQHRPGFRAAFSLSMPILHVAVHTILSQSSGLWEHLPQLIGFAGRLGFWGRAGRLARREGGGGGLVLVVVGMCSVVQRVESLLFPASLVCVCVCVPRCVLLFLALLRPPRETRVSLPSHPSRSAWCL